jgi:uncharacterized protein (TIGR02118 family)
MMIRVSVFYPNSQGSRFDMEYYVARHMPMVQQKLGAALKRMEIDQGIAGGAPGSAPPYTAGCHLFFDSVEAFQAAFGPHANTILADIPNYTNTQPTIQISDVRM